MRIDDVLVSSKLIDAESLIRAKEIQRRDGSSLGRAIATLGAADEETVAAALARGLRLEYLQPEAIDLSNELLAKLSIEFCRKSLLVPLASKRRGLSIAMANPLDYAVIQTLEFRLGKSVVVVIASESAIVASLDAADETRANADRVNHMLQVVNPAGEVETLQHLEHELVSPAVLAKDTTTAPIVRLVNMVLSEAVVAGASDIHVEPQESCVQVRHRIDGLLRDVLRIPHHLQDAMISRLKIISGADIAERRKPQDGRTRLKYEGRRIDMRVSTLPTQFGEKVVIRLLDNSSGPRQLEDLDLSPENFTILHDLLMRPQGMLLVTGPTGSGKTSTLYSAIQHIKSATRNIITVEDPIEIQLPGINQVQVNTRIGVTFALGLRSILRQDPNVILVGEIRDTETAAMACEASQTGHLLMSTLHTNDATATITRLVDLSVEPFLVASSLIGIVAQRLVRRTCQFCKAPKIPSADALLKSGAKAILKDEPVWTAGSGCERCEQSGFLGRTAIHELLVVTDEIRELIASKAPEHAIRKTARMQGMKMMIEDAVAKAASGLTTLDEVVRIVGAADTSFFQQPAAAGTEPVFQMGERKLRVLVVEDSPTISTVVKYFLELDGFEVAVADDGAKGLAMAKSEPPDLIISDICRSLTASACFGLCAPIRPLRKFPY
jgi:type IV pilus assembly protein PilB